MLSAAFIVPLLYNQIDWASDMQRPPAYGLGIEWGLLAILFPHPLTHASFPGNLGLREYSTQLYYSGTLFCLATFLAWSMLLAYRRAGLPGTGKACGCEMWAGNVWLFSAALMLMISLGPAGIAWPLMSKLPIVSKVNNNPVPGLALFQLSSPSWRAGLSSRGYCDLCQIMRHEGGGLGAGDRLGRGPADAVPRFDRPARPVRLWRQAVSGLAEGDGRSARLDAAHRVPSGDRRFAAEVYAPGSCAGDGAYLSLRSYSVLSYYGDDPLVASKPLFSAGYKRMSDDPLAAAQAYGIRWLLVHKDVMEIYDFYKHPEKLKPEEIAKRNPEEFYITHGVGSPPPYNRIFEPLYQHSRQVLSYPDVEVREIEGPCRPLAFCESAPDVALPIQSERPRSEGRSWRLGPEADGTRSCLLPLMSW